MRRQVLISYHKSDTALVQRLDDDLLKRGIEVWRDTRSFKAGQSRRQATYDGIVKSDCFIACLSPQFLKDAFCRTQLFLARAYNKQILPILVSSFPPGTSPIIELLKAGQQHGHEIKGIEELDLADFSGKYSYGLGSYERNFEKLVDAIQPVTKPVPLKSELIYVSYNYREENFATRLAKDLELARGRIWIDKLSIQLGSTWRKSMYEGLRTANHFVVCLSPEAARSENVSHEVLVAKMRGIPIYPVSSERVNSDAKLRSKLETALNKSDEMKFLADLQWFCPDPGYQDLLTALKKSIGLAEPERILKQGIFISYRRADSQAVTGRIHERLVQEFGAETVFMDVDTIPLGEDFAQYYKGWLKDRAVVVLIIIGKTWASIKIKKKKGEPPRLQKEDDHVRIEVETALKMKGLKVIPVLVEGAKMPESADLPESLRGLNLLEGSEVRNDPDFGSDLGKLIKGINKSQRPG